MIQPPYRLDRDAREGVLASLRGHCSRTARTGVGIYWRRLYERTMFMQSWRLRLDLRRS